MGSATKIAFAASITVYLLCTLTIPESGATISVYHDSVNTVVNRTEAATLAEDSEKESLVDDGQQIADTGTLETNLEDQTVDEIDNEIVSDDVGSSTSGSLQSSSNSTLEKLYGDAVPHSLTYDAMYEEGVKCYLESDWNQCVGYMQVAIKDYHWYHEQLVRCRRDCKTEAEAATLLTTPLDGTQIFFERTIRSALCLLKCRRETFAARNNHVAALTIDRDFEIKKPYDYLQLCLFKVGRIQEAASAAVTVLASQPDHTVMTANLKQYIEDFSAIPEEMVNLELQDYANEYVLGDRAHSEERYESSVEHMERAVDLYWTAVDECRIMCEEPFDQGWFPDFVSSVANHFTFTFRCKRRCTNKLSNLYGKEVPNFLASIFNYLQFGYQKLEKVPQACGAVESFLEQLPADAAMLRNKQFYLTEYQKMDKFFVPSKEVVAHVARERYEADLLHFIDTEFVFLEDDATAAADDSKQSAKATLSETLSSLVSAVFSGASTLTNPVLVEEL